MNCEFCELKLNLITIKNLFHRDILSTDFDEDGYQMKICPNCYSLDNFSLKEIRKLQRRLNDNNITISRDDKKSVIKFLCMKSRYTYKQKSSTVKLVMKKLEQKSDSQTINIISNHFSVSKLRVNSLFYATKIYYLITK